ncbi:MAG: ABC transporter permease subunit [Anaerolineae bacterium]
MATDALAQARPARPRAVAETKALWDWLGLAPFFVFSAAFLLLPTAYLLWGSLQDKQGQFTLENVAGLFQPAILDAYWLSIQISVVTSLVGGVFGFLIAFAITRLKTPHHVRTGFLTFSGVAANFAGVPLAFAFIATLGRTGFLTGVLKNTLGIDLYGYGFNLYSFLGISLTYMYFQLPLMVLIITPGIQGLRREWEEAAASLGATPWQYWRHVGFPILLPSLLGTMILLFGNAFGAYATAFALTGGTFGLATILIGRQIRGDVLQNPGLGYAVAAGMIFIMALCIGVYTLLQRRTERWLK